MPTCCIFANLYDADLSPEQNSDIIKVIEYLINKERIDTYYIAENRRFEEICEDWINNPHHLYYEYKIQRFPQGDPYELYYKDMFRKPPILIGDFIICDETTKYFVINHIRVDMIIKRPQTGIYIIVRAKNDFTVK